MQRKITDIFSINPSSSKLVNADEGLAAGELSDAEEVIIDPEYSKEAISEADEVTIDDEQLSRSNSPQQGKRKRRKKSHQKPAGGRSKFHKEYEEKYRKEFIEKSSKGVDQFFCKACDSHLKLRKQGEAAIKSHLITPKHKENVIELNKNVPIAQFGKKRTKNEEKLALATELAVSFHSAVHNFSIRSADCTSTLISTFFSGHASADNFASKRTKTRALIVGVLSPFLQKRMLEEAICSPYFSLGIDSTPFDKERFHAIVIRYFNNGIKTKLLEIISETSEKALDMAKFVTESLAKFGLYIERMAGLTADNTSANFGGISRGGRNNLFYLLKQTNKKLIGIGCSSHICNNSIKYALEQLDYDLVQFCTTICSHFSNHAGRWELFKQYGEDLGIQVHIFPDYTVTRWLSIGRLCVEIKRQWPIVEKYFRSISDRDCPKLIRRIFNDEMTTKADEFKTLISFISFILTIFNRFNLISQKTALSLPDLLKAMRALKQKIQLAISDSFFGEETMQLLQNLDENGAHETRAKLEKTFKEFCTNSLEYLNKWNVHLEESGEAVSDWIVFETQPSIEKITAAYKQFCGNTAEELDHLFDEIAELNEMLENLNKTEFIQKSSEEKWCILFKNANFIYLKKLVSFIFSIFPTNAYCESVFSIVKNTKTDERNQMSLKLLNSLVSIKCNADFNCSQAFDIFLSNSDLLSEVKSDKKYEE